MNSNLIRFSGMASGMDTEGVIKQLMQAKRVKADKYTQAKTKNEWKQEAYIKLNKDLANFVLESRKKLSLTKYTYTGQLYPNSINEVDWAKKANASSSEYFDSSALANAQSGKYAVQVDQLATNATITGKAISSVKSTDKLEQDVNLKLKINGQVKTVNLKSDDTISSAIKKIKDETDLSVSFGQVGQDADSNITSMLFISSKKTGTSQSIEVLDEASKDFFEKLGVDRGALQDEIKGTNSKIRVNSSVIENQTNDVNINGIKLSLKKVSTTAVDVTVSTDTDSIFEKIKGFVDDYNKIIDNLQKKVAEKTYRDFRPLTKEQKEAMNENDVKLWEEKSKSGLLRNDHTIKSMVSQIREDAYQDVSGASAMYKLGITTGKYNDGAKLQIDEKKLKEAISKDPQKVLETLFKSSDDITNYRIEKNDSPEVRAEKLAKIKEQKANTGVFVRIMDDVSKGIEDIVKQAGSGNETSLLKQVRGNILADFLSGKSNIDLDILSIDKRLDAENSRLNSYESALWKKFSAMEKAVQQMQGQSGWLSQQFAGR